MQRAQAPDQTETATQDWASAPPGLALFDPLAVYCYRVELTLERDLMLPAAQRAVLWRGAFGSVFRSLVCHDRSLVCEQCALHAACPFPRDFAPKIPPDRPNILRLSDPPRPFVITDPEPESETLKGNAPLSLGFTVVGTAVVDLPYFVVALRRLGDDGISRRRVRFATEAVRAVDAQGMPVAAVYERGAETVRAARLPVRARDLLRAGDGEATRVRVEFITPTDIRGASSDPGRAPAFGALVRRARDRISALATFFGEAPLEFDASGLATAADQVELVASEVSRAGVSRRSARTGQVHSVSGIVGSATYEGAAVRTAMPWLRLAEVVGVGKHATFGNGRIALDTCGRPGISVAAANSVAMDSYGELCDEPGWRRE